MPFLELTTTASQHSPDEVENCFFGAGALTVTLADAADHPILEPKPGMTPLWPTVRISGLFDANSDVQHLLQAIRSGLEDQELEITCKLIEDKVWEREWLKDFKPMRFGQSLWVCPGGQTPPEDFDAERVIWLDPGLAFGTGTHATTALCLEFIDANAPTHQKVLDVGCGSGILSIASVKFGARYVHALDIDPQALIATEDNARRNEVFAAIHLTDEHARWDADHDLILANILAEPLIELAPKLAQACRKAGRVVLSGLLDVQANEVGAAYEPYFEMAPATFKDGWAMLTGTRRAL